jgi:hypothetical protein
MLHAQADSLTPTEQEAGPQSLTRIRNISYLYWEANPYSLACTWPSRFGERGLAVVNMKLDAPYNQRRPSRYELWRNTLQNGVTECNCCPESSETVCKKCLFPDLANIYLS